MGIVKNSARVGRSGYNFKLPFFLFLNIAGLFGEKKYVIGERYAGFFSCFITVLNHLRYCEKVNNESLESKKLIPVVRWGPSSLYYHPAGFNGVKDNVWEYYFLPVSNLEYQPGDLIHSSNNAPDGFQIHLGRNYSSICRDLRVRLSMNLVFRKYVVLKGALRKKIEDFYSKNIKGKFTVGIHLRGLDKIQERKIPINKIIDEANKFVPCQFFVATDDKILLAYARKFLKGKVLTTDSSRGYGLVGLHSPKKKVFKPKLGEDVIIDAFLLAKCDKFIHTGSNVAASVLFMNPNLDATLL